MPVSLRNCSGTECGSVVASGVVRSIRSMSSNVPAPVPCAGLSVKPCHASVHQRQRLLELPLRIRFGSFVTCELTLFENSCQRALTKSPGPPARTTASGERDQQEDDERHRRVRATRRSTARDNTKRIATAARTRPTTNTAPNTRPSCTRTSCGCPSELTPGRSRATPETAAPGDPRNGQRPERVEPVAVEPEPEHGRGDEGSTMPTREYVRTATTSAV